MTFYGRHSKNRFLAQAGRFKASILKTVILAEAGRFKANLLKTVILAQTGRFKANILKTVILAQAGIHTELIKKVMRAQHGFPPARTAVRNKFLDY
jgi:hypothetical protein